MIVIFNSFPYEQEFGDYLEVELGCSPLTVETYLMHLRQFFFFLGLDYFPDGLEDVRDIDSGYVRAYLHFLTRERASHPRTRNNKKSTLSTYFNFFIGETGYNWYTNNCRTDLR